MAGNLISMIINDFSTGFAYIVGIQHDESIFVIQCISLAFLCRSSVQLISKGLQGMPACHCVKMFNSTIGNMMTLTPQFFRIFLVPSTLPR